MNTNATLPPQSLQPLQPLRIGIGGPVTRVTPDRVDELARLVIDAADGLSRRLGASQSGAYNRAARRVRATTPSTPRPSAALRAVR